MSIEISDFGKDLNGNCVKLFSISNFNGLVAKVTNFGAVLVSLFVPGQAEVRPRHLPAKTPLPLIPMCSSVISFVRLSYQFCS